jgi:hypothetical protein
MNILKEIDALASSPVMEGRYLQMIGVDKYDFSAEFRKVLNSALGVNMDIDLTTLRIFNPSETKIARAILEDVSADSQFIYIIRSRGDVDGKKTTKEAAEKGDYNFEFDGSHKTGEISDEDAEAIEKATVLHNFYILTNIRRLAKRIQPNISTGGGNRIYLINNVGGVGELSVEVITATLTNLVEFLRQNTSTINFVYKLLAKEEHAKFLRVPLQAMSDEGSVVTPGQPGAADGEPVEPDADEAKSDEKKSDDNDADAKKAGDEEETDDLAAVRPGGGFKLGDRTTLKDDVGQITDGFYLAVHTSGTPVEVVSEGEHFIVIRALTDNPHLTEPFMTIRENLEAL